MGPGLSLGFIRWVQMYAALVEGKYLGWKEAQLGFQHLAILFRKNDNCEIMKRKLIKQLDCF